MAGVGELAGAPGATAGMAGEAGEPPACVTSNDCSNGAACNGAGACVCTARFNGKHCEFQVFRGIGMLQGDTGSSVYGISHDGSVVFGSSYSSGVALDHAFRSVNGAALQFIAEPTA